MKREPKFATEADLCAAFIRWAKEQGGRSSRTAPTPAWIAYAETAGWDILLVGADGTQIGIQAKQRFNMKVLQQTIPDGCYGSWHDDGPDYRAILIPERDHDADAICGALGITVFAPAGHTGYDDDMKLLHDFTPRLDFENCFGGWHYWSPRKRCELPDFVPDVVAGASGPVQLTKWKVQALRLIARIEIRGHVTRADFRMLGMDARRWLGPQGWLQVDPARPGEFTRGDALDFDQQHPAVYAQVLEEARSQEIVA